MTYHIFEYVLIGFIYSLSMNIINTYFIKQLPPPTLDIRKYTILEVLILIAFWPFFIILFIISLFSPKQ